MKKVKEIAFAISVLLYLASTATFFIEYHLMDNIFISYFLMLFAWMFLIIAFVKEGCK